MTFGYGSSPLARGLLNEIWVVNADRGIIPARAGFTRSRWTRVWTARGSSPLARGLRPHPQRPRPPRRIIPARAGFTYPFTSANRAPTDHPRSRGVYLDEREDLSEEGGSSPLARGLPPPGRSCCFPSGIIPARAGFTSCTAGTSSPTEDHPRSRGVYTGSPSATLRKAGSSPLARGLLLVGDRRRRRNRIIPARAGFTGMMGRSGTSPMDHPRSRGVYTYAAVRGQDHGDHPRSRGVYADPEEIRVTVYGSSPLARGLHDRVRFRGTRARIIPARAGFTRGNWGNRKVRADHPRSRGVYGGCSCPPTVTGGSSPLARGLRFSMWCQYWTRRIIPARAGFTSPFCHRTR